MHNRNLFVLILAFSVVSFAVHAISPFNRHILSTTNTRTYDSPYLMNLTESVYHYSNTEPVLIDSIIVTTTTTTTLGTDIQVSRSYFEHTIEIFEDQTKIVYNQNTVPGNGYNGYYMFLFDANGNTREMIVKSPAEADSLHLYYHYLSENKPDSMYIKTVIDGNTSYSSYKMQYDEQNRLVSSIQQVNMGYGWYNYRKTVSNYGVNAFHYPHPLDYDNYRYQSVVGGGFEESNPIFDKYYAPESITYMSWNAGSWIEYPFSFYNVQVSGNTITLINNRYEEYNGSFYFDETGRYTGKFVDDLANNSEVIFTINWAETNAIDDDTAPSVNQILTLYPNPFQTNLKMKSIADTDISIFNIKGQLVRSFNHSKEQTWDGKDLTNKTVSPGIYLVKARQGNTVSCRKVIKL